MEFTTTGLNAFIGTASNYFSWTNVQFNVTLNDDLLCDVQKSDYDIFIASAGCLQGGPSRYFFDEWDSVPMIFTSYIFPGTTARYLLAKFLDEFPHFHEKEMSEAQKFSTLLEVVAGKSRR